MTSFDHAFRVYLESFSMKQYLLLFVMCFSVNGSQVWADNFIPKRKAGLWQISVNEVGKKQQHGLKQCIDELTDQKMMQMGMDLFPASQDWQDVLPSDEPCRS